MVRRLLENHYHYTDSARARRLLDDWDDAVDAFVKVMPDAFARAVEEQLAEGRDPRADVPEPVYEERKPARGDD
jgi:glutamate synthase (NADPH/NADH) large chain